MLSIFDGVRNITMLSVTVRLCLAVLCGGLIGLERAFKRRPAGFRTHILICIGAAITTLTSQYLYLNMHYFTDMARLGDQVDGQRPLAVIHAKDENSWQEAAKAVKAAIKLADKAPESTPTVYRRISE